MGNNTMPRRVGRFRITRAFVIDGDVGVRRIMSQCIIVRAEMIFIADVIEYEAISWRFREISEGEVLPEYQWAFNDDTGELSVKEVTHD